MESEPGQGARFYFTIPKDLASGSEAVVRCSAPGSDSPAAPGSTKSPGAVGSVKFPPTELKA